MTTREFLASLRSKDVQLWAEGEKLRYKAPAGALTPALSAEIIARKAELLKVLSATKVSIPDIVPASRDGTLPLSFAQERLWFLVQLEPTSTLYNIPAAFRLNGPLEIAALEQSLNELVRRHEALRTTFRSLDGIPRQVVAPVLTLELPVVDISHHPENDREHEARRLVAQQNKQAFDLTLGPLIRTTLLRLHRDEHILLVNMHHIVSDGWSMGILFRELSVLYNAFSNGDPSPLDPLPLHYADYAVWQREWLAGEILEKQLSYWRKQLENLSPLQLPTDRPRPAVQTYRGARQSLVLSKDLSERLSGLSRKQGVTLFMTLLAACQTLLHRYTAQDDIAVGSPIAGRNRPEIEPLIGCF